MRRGYSSSCGCWRREFSVVTKTTHGMSPKSYTRRSKIYGVWCGMKGRCHNPNQPHYRRYGGRGIKVCDEWRNSFDAFYRDMGEPPKDGQRWTLDRIDVNGNYEPGNVRWATYRQQNDPDNKRPKFHMEEVAAAFHKLIATPEGKEALEKLWPNGTWLAVKRDKKSP